MHVVGVDGCPDGWLAVNYEDQKYNRTDLYQNIEELWENHRDAETILIDVPIGLREKSNDKRHCDSKAREKLSPDRHTSVFPTPVREAVHCEDYESAKAKQEKLTDGSLGTQTWAISDKIKELDEFLRNTEDARGIVREAHPEVCFWAFNDEEAIEYSKTSQPLTAFWSRVNVLERVDEDVLTHLRDGGLAVETEASNDDLLDAFVLALTASARTGPLQTLPEDPEDDPKGLPMEMVYAVR
ncbi:DUF429 domain-containing protein [Haloprofundus halophilus]|uniref:DUF429 domain-containing protein n=1 Tax=Haloprofundus halophilus TaxID=2283527 RepID=UPI000E44027A|nr:DUF429 domain-containing protein [Haloprofundus halophilus]